MFRIHIPYATVEQRVVGFKTLNKVYCVPHPYATVEQRVVGFKALNKVYCVTHPYAILYTLYSRVLLRGYHYLLKP